MPPPPSQPPGRSAERSSLPASNQTNPGQSDVLNLIPVCLMMSVVLLLVGADLQMMQKNESVMRKYDYGSAKENKWA